MNVQIDNFQTNVLGQYLYDAIQTAVENHLSKMPETVGRYIAQAIKESSDDSYRKKEREILRYCAPHLDKMWASTIAAIVLGCDFRDVKAAMQKGDL